jgi:uncharacterized protein YgiM (DUF1202 family)
VRTGRTIIGLLAIGFLGSAILGDRSEEAPWKRPESPRSASSTPDPALGPRLNGSGAAAIETRDENLASPAGAVVVVEASSLIMRAEPSPRAPVIGAYPRGTEMIVQRKQGSWYRVTSPDGNTGWMAAGYLSELPD